MAARNRRAPNVPDVDNTIDLVQVDGLVCIFIGSHVFANFLLHIIHQIVKSTHMELILSPPFFIARLWQKLSNTAMKREAVRWMWLKESYWA